MYTCIGYDTFAELVDDINGRIATTAAKGEGVDDTTTAQSPLTLCICPKDYSPQDVTFGGTIMDNYGVQLDFVSSNGYDTCGTRRSSATMNTTSDTTTAVVAIGRSSSNITTTYNNNNNNIDSHKLTIEIPFGIELELICASPPANSRLCYFGCRDQIFKVNGGGILIIHGFTLSGGKIPHPNDYDDVSEITTANSRIEVTSQQKTPTPGGGRLIMIDSTISWTQTIHRGGAIMNDGGFVSLYDTMILKSYALHEGGAIYSSGMLEIYGDNSMILSSTSDIAGGGLFLDVGSTTKFQNTRFNFNESPNSNNDDGGGSNNPDIYISDSIQTSDVISIDGCGELISLTGSVEKTTTLTTRYGDVVAEIRPCKDSSSSASASSLNLSAVTKLVGFGVMIIASLML